MKIRNEIKLKESVRFEELRVDQDKKQNEISKILNVKRNTYSKWENCINDIPLEKCNQLANYYNVDLNYILGLTDNKEKFSTSLTIDWKLLSKRLRELRKNNKLSQKELSEKVGFNNFTYAKYEEGINKPTTIKLLNIALFYNVSLDYLVGRSNNYKIK